MAKTLEQKMAALSPARRKKVEARTAELIEDEKSICDLRRALALTQETIAEELGIGQDERPTLGVPSGRPRESYVAQARVICFTGVKIEANSTLSDSKWWIAQERHQ